MAKERKRKADKAEYERRVNYIVGLKLKGLTQSEILHLIAQEKKEWGVCERQIKYYIRDATAKIIEQGEYDIKKFRAETYLRMEDIFKQHHLSRDFSECRKDLLAMNKVLGFEKLNVDHSGEVKMTYEERIKKLREDKGLPPIKAGDNE